MKNLLLSFILLFLGDGIYAGDSLSVSIQAKVLVQGDTLEFSCSIPDYVALQLTSATLHVWIDNLENNKRWKFRYPMINGETAASLAISDKIPDGRYAVNFLVQRGFLKIAGKVQAHDKNDTLINYMMILKNKKATYVDVAKVARDGSFRLKSTLFADSAYFIFTPNNKRKKNDLLINIESPLDSFFIPAITTTQFIMVGKQSAELSGIKDTSQYSFSIKDPIDKNELPGVTVFGKSRKKIEQYDEENSKGLFKRNDAIIFDGLDKDEISRSFSVFQFLQGRVAGLTIEMDSMGNEVAKWRKEIAEIYVDEFKMEPGDHLFVNTNEIAMIKVYRPPARISSFSGGAGVIAIYTKYGKYAPNKARHNFIVKGYSTIDSVWE
jgi:hypothetical protein